MKSKLLIFYLVSFLFSFLWIVFASATFFIILLYTLNHYTPSVIPFLLSRSQVNSLGLTIDLFGAVVIWKFGLPDKIDLEGKPYLVTEEINKDEEELGLIYKNISAYGINFLILGFFLQLLSNFAAN